jgi:hypothetical protein
MKAEFLNSINDIGWLQTTHLKQYHFVFNSFIIYGNEDCPDKIELFKRLEPTINSKPFAVFLSDSEGNLYLDKY